jgi:TonB family protein
MNLKLLMLSLAISNLVYGQEQIRKFKYKDVLPIKPRGIWEFYDFNGDLEQKYDFTNQRLLFHKTDIKKDTLKYKMIVGIDTILTMLDRPPLIIGGSSLWRSTAMKLLRYPPNAAKNGIHGKATISIIIDKSGKPISYKIKHRVGGGIDEEALRVIKLVPYGWLPGVLNGENVVAEILLNLNFQLEE